MGYRAEQLFAILRSLTPTLLGVLGVIVLALPFRFFEGILPTPIIPLVVVFFWSIYSPDFLPSPSVFGGSAARYRLMIACSSRPLLLAGTATRTRK